MQFIISIVTPFDFPRQVEYSCVISLSAAKLPRTITRSTRKHATTPNATVKSSTPVFMRGRRGARTSDGMIRSPSPRWDTILDRIASDRCQPRAGLQGIPNWRGSVSGSCEHRAATPVDFAERNVMECLHDRIGLARA